MQQSGNALRQGLTAVLQNRKSRGAPFFQQEPSLFFRRGEFFSRGDPSPRIIRLLLQKGQRVFIFQKQTAGRFTAQSRSRFTYGPKYTAKARVIAANLAQMLFSQHLINFAQVFPVQKRTALLFIQKEKETAVFLPDTAAQPVTERAGYLLVKSSGVWVDINFPPQAAVVMTVTAQAGEAGEKRGGAYPRAKNLLSIKDPLCTFCTGDLVCLSKITSDLKSRGSAYRSGH